MRMNRQIMLITYADSLGRNLRELREVLADDFPGAVGGVHLLPFFPSSADRGFAPTRYDQVDPAFGTWDDVEALGEDHYLMFDFMINHLSRQSAEYQDMVRRGKDSPYWSLFLHYAEFWPGGAPSAAQQELVYKRKPRAPYLEETLAGGKAEKLWCTFSEEQVDLDVNAPVTKAFIRDTIQALAARKMSVLRLDAFAYAVIKPDTNCFFMEPDIWNLLEEVQKTADEYGVTLLPEIHEHYSIQLKLADRGYWVYDFALPMLLLYTLYTADARPLKHWLSICPDRQFTTLDTHDGIGVVDAKDLLTDAQLEQTVECLYRQGGNANRVYSSADYHNLDLYQINCTYYAAVGCDDDAYLLARAIQFFAPGIPQVYYVGMLAGENDIALVEATRNGRDINRHNYTAREVDEAFTRPVVKKLCELMRLRNASIAFKGDCVVEETQDPVLRIRRSHAGETLVLNANLQTYHFCVEQQTQSGSRVMFAR